MALDTLASIEGLDDVPLFDDLSLELETADGYTGGDALLGDEIDLEELLEDSPQL